MNLGFVFFLGIFLVQTRAVMLDLSDEKLWLHLEVAHASARETGFRNVAESLLRKVRGLSSECETAAACSFLVGIC